MATDLHTSQAAVQITAMVAVTAVDMDAIVVADTNNLNAKQSMLLKQ
jgi:hypothetical protein